MSLEIPELLGHARAHGQRGADADAQRSIFGQHRGAGVTDDRQRSRGGEVNQLVAPDPGICGPGIGAGDPGTGQRRRQ